MAYNTPFAISFIIAKTTSDPIVLDTRVLKMIQTHSMSQCL